jgi:tRNA 2-selenouridine synthase
MILREYGRMAESDLTAAIHKITKRMGGQNVKAAVEAIQAGDLDQAIDILLDYYDKIYLANKAKMDREIFLDLPVDAPWSDATTKRLIELADSPALKLAVSR